MQTMDNVPMSVLAESLGFYALETALTFGQDFSVCNMRVFPFGLVLPFVAPCFLLGARRFCRSACFVVPPAHRSLSV